MNEQNKKGRQKVSERKHVVRPTFEKVCKECSVKRDSSRAQVTRTSLFIPQSVLLSPRAHKRLAFRPLSLPLRACKHDQVLIYITTLAASNGRTQSGASLNIS